MMYRNEDSVTFCTLALGETYLSKASLLIQSILKFTNHKIYIITDNVEYFGNYYSKKRVKFIDIKTLTDMPFTIENRFNYHLKCIPLKYVKDNVPNLDTIVYLDADSFLFGWSNTLNTSLNRYTPEMSYGAAFCRLRTKIKHTTDEVTLNILKRKCQEHGVNFEDMDVALPIECVMIFKCGNRFDVFVENWVNLAKKVCQNNYNPFMEAFEMGLASLQAELTMVDFDYRFAEVDDFRVLHHEKIMQQFII